MIVPDGIDDPSRPSGGNVYDRRLCRELAAAGTPVREHAVQGSWPTPAATHLAALGEVVAGIPDGHVVLVDGLVASTAPEVLVPASGRLRMVVLVHMPLGDDTAGEQPVEVRTREGAVLAAAAAVVTPSVWTRSRLLERHSLQAERVTVVEPGADPAEIAPGTTTGGALLCVAAVAPHKGHDVLLAALALLAHRSWHCTCVGSLDRDPAFVEQLRARARGDGISDRIRWTGPLTGKGLDDAYAGADVLVVASRGESYGMVVTEALARALPVVATAVGGVPEALGRGSDGSRPGLLVPPDAPVDLAEALSGWLSDAQLRRRLRRAAEQRRTTLSGWSATADHIRRVVAEVA